MARKVRSKQLPATVPSPDIVPPPPNPRPKSPKWQLPVAMESGFSTFIDHGTLLDRQGYPLYPNQSTTFVVPQNTRFENIPKVGYSQTVNVNNRNNNSWKVIHVKCLGVMLCDREECKYAGPPPTGPRKIQELLSTASVAQGGL
ncbi:hypothetical protein PTTG_03374 [Puccinia triticina 1-1 BBBD Race 1]|uniref:Uncharacterized protein n=1 Tax=Puccinia triticina (isolate 1-1 / race 1 (BBBD)) TaxID=630390 RepID=A0A180GPJ5_PUCT1|nr:hypothetical protein PTTG_03374 [Puccinia triticina 1-1 BBBD Race 1]